MSAVNPIECGRGHATLERMRQAGSEVTEGREEPTFRETLLELARRASTWIAEHEEEITAFMRWHLLLRACEATKLYAPPVPSAWWTIADAVEASADSAQLEALILTIYGPGGEGYDTLCNELHSAPLLVLRHEEVDEVIVSLEEGRYYVTICGALPLVEGLLADAYGKWQKHLDDYPIKDRLERSGALPSEVESELLINSSAVDMVTVGIPEIWESRRMSVGESDTDLNRHLALHGTGRGWNTKANAIRSILLIAAAARVAEPLLGPQPERMDDDG
jgi:hypothetical protein